MILEKKITELDSNLVTSRKCFDDERDQFLNKIKNLEQQLSDKTLQNVFQKIPDKSDTTTKTDLEKEFDNLMNSETCLKEELDLFNHSNKSKDSSILK